ncbi:MAG: flagellar export protein FliJ [Gemmatimonadales bacterium]|nr:MAG: flagellar export protein FliJ [Gemmatimonadales bacterium]
MKAFRFRLAPVLEHRRREEEARSQELARARQDATAARSSRESLEAVLVSEREAFSSSRAMGPAGALRNHLAVLEQIRSRVEDASSLESEAVETVAQRVSALKEASRDREVLSRLEGRRRTEWLEAWKRREQQSSDETALSRHYRARILEEER